MKRILFFAVLTAAFVTASCDNLSSIKSEDFVRETSVKLVEGNDYNQTFTVSLEYAVKGTNSEALRNINSTIAQNAFGIENDDFGKAFEAFIDIQGKEYISSNMDLFREAAKEVSNTEEENNAFNSTFNWVRDLQGSFSKAHKGIISYVLNSYFYEGGAHGLYNTSVINFNVKTGEVIKEEDFFVDNYKKDLSKLLTENLASSIGNSETYESLFVKEIEPNGNFEVTEEGISYIYNPYEIGPYALGLIEVNIPWRSLKNLVR